MNKLFVLPKFVTVQPGQAIKPSFLPAGGNSQLDERPVRLLIQSTQQSQNSISQNGEPACVSARGSACVEEPDEEMPLSDRNAPTMSSKIQEPVMQLSTQERSPQPQSIETSFRPMYRRYLDAGQRGVSDSIQSEKELPPRRPAPVEDSPKNLSTAERASNGSRPKQQNLLFSKTEERSENGQGASQVGTGQLPTQWAFKTKPLPTEEATVPVTKAMKQNSKDKQNNLEDKLDALLRKVTQLDEKVNASKVPEPSLQNASNRQQSPRPAASRTEELQQKQAVLESAPEQMLQQYQEFARSAPFQPQQGEQERLLQEQNSALKEQLSFVQRQCEMLMAFNTRQQTPVIPARSPPRPAHDSIAEWAAVQSKIQRREDTFHAPPALVEESPAPKRTYLRDPYAAQQRRAAQAGAPEVFLPFATEQTEPQTQRKPVASKLPVPEIEDPYRPPERVPKIAGKPTARQTATQAAKQNQHTTAKPTQQTVERIVMEPFVFDPEINALEQQMNQLAIRAQNLF